MEYYYLAPIGILFSGKERTKEEVKRLLTYAHQTETENPIHYLQKQGIHRAFTLVTPRFKFKFDSQNEDIIELN